MALLSDVGVDIEDVTDVLIAEGVEKFAAAFESLLSAIESKRATIAG